MKKVTVQIQDYKLEAEVLKENYYTVVVKLPDGNVVKRHKRKHNVTEV